MGARRADLHRCGDLPGARQLRVELIDDSSGVRIVRPWDEPRLLARLSGAASAEPPATPPRGIELVHGRIRTVPGSLPPQRIGAWALAAGAALVTVAVTAWQVPLAALAAVPLAVVAVVGAVMSMDSASTRWTELSVTPLALVVHRDGRRTELPLATLHDLALIRIAAVGSQRGGPVLVATDDRQAVELGEGLDPVARSGT